MTRYRMSFFPMLVAIPALLSLSAAAQGTDPPPAPSEEQALEERWIQMKLEQGESHASGLRPELGPVILGNPTQAVVALRVGLYYSYTSTGAYSEFASLHHPFVDVSNTVGDAHVLDRASGKQIVAIAPGTIVHVARDGTGYQVSLGGAPFGTFGGPIFFRPTDAANLFRVESIRRSFGGVQVPLYRGALEVARGSATQASRVNLVNLVELEDYVPGVVANESLSSFHVDALKAQAVAARGYAVANVGRYQGLGYPFDLVDSSSSQVYRGFISEHPKAVQAAAETTGLVASYEGRIISALYSSSFGGHSESNEWIFNNPSSQLPGTNVTPYLRGVYDGEGAPPDFTSEAELAAFWTVPQPAIFDDCARVGNRFSRWRIVLTGAQIKARLTPGRYVLLAGDVTGSIAEVRLVTRMGASARAAIARIGLTTGEVEVRGWDNLRNVLGRTAASTPATCAASPIAANFTLDNPSVIEVAKNLEGHGRPGDGVGWRLGTQRRAEPVRIQRQGKGGPGLPADPEGVLHGGGRGRLPARHRPGAGRRTAHAAAVVLRAERAGHPRGAAGGPQGAARAHQSGVRPLLRRGRARGGHGDVGRLALSRARAQRGPVQPGRARGEGDRHRRHRVAARTGEPARERSARRASRRPTPRFRRSSFHTITSSITL